MVLQVLPACGGEVGVIPLEEEAGDLRPGLTVRVELDEVAQDLGAALGWENGVPDAEVRFHRTGTEFGWRTATTDSSGVVHFPDATRGKWRIAALRAVGLDDGRGAVDRVRALSDGRFVRVEGATEAALRLRPDDPGSVVISEVYATSPFVAETQYDFHYYIELYNNSSRTVFLDGMIVGPNVNISNRGAENRTCHDSRPFRTDSLGVWARYFHRFPGSGSEHPLEPGEATVVALDAVNHAEVHPALPDLGSAPYELFGSSDVDNPAAVNLPEVGLAPWFQGHGIRFFVGDAFFLARPLEVSELLRRTYHVLGTDVDYVRLPAEALVDVMWTEEDDVLDEQRFDICSGLVHRRFDALGGGFVKHGEDLEFSVQRTVLTTVDGRAILQDTNTSAVDLIRARYTPGGLPR